MILDRPADLIERYCEPGWAKDHALNDPIWDTHWRVGKARAHLASSHRLDLKRVWSVRVKEKHRGQGHGRHLMEVLTTYSDGIGMGLDLFVYVGNEPAVRLYQSVGFVIRNSIPADPLWLEPTDRFYMLREVTS